MVSDSLQDEGDWFYVACGQGENEDSCDIIHEAFHCMEMRKYVMPQKHILARLSK